MSTSSQTSHKSYRPLISKEDVETLLLSEYGLQTLNIKELNGYDDKNYHVLVSDKISNDNISSKCITGYVLKVINSSDSKKPELFDAQTGLLLHLGAKKVLCPKPIKTKSGKYYTIQHLRSGSHLVRLLEYIDGEILHKVPASQYLCFRCGKYVAELDEYMKDYHHDIYKNHRSLWMMESVPMVANYLGSVSDLEKLALCESVLKQFNEKVVPLVPQLEKGLIHGDFNEQNILVKKEDDWVPVGVIDFGDSQYSCYLFELAIAITYLIIEARDIRVGGYVIKGYETVRKLPLEEYQLLRICVGARFVQSLVLGAHFNSLEPENVYMLTTAEKGWELLKILWNEPEQELLKMWKGA